MTVPPESPAPRLQPGEPTAWEQIDARLVRLTELHAAVVGEINANVREYEQLVERERQIMAEYDSLRRKL